MQKLLIDDLNLKGKRVLLRVDFNVPLKNGKVEDDTRIRETIPTIKKVLEDGGIPIIISHLGRPKGKKDPAFSLKPVAETLSRLIEKKVTFLPDCIGPEIESKIRAGHRGDIFLLENLRFYKEEEENDPEFARALASLGDVFVNDAFATAHRAHASTVGVTKYLKKCAAGYLMAKEIQNLSTILENPKRPFVAVVGGAKISTKLPVLKNLLRLVDKLLIGGGLSYTFFKALGGEIGKSICEEDQIPNAAEILQSHYADKKIIFPIDCVVTDSLEKPNRIEVVHWDSIPEELGGVDIGPKTAELFASEILSARSVLINGPMGVFEVKPFDRGTRAVFEAIVEVTRKGGFTVAGGGETVEALNKLGFKGMLTHESTGGGASLEFLEGKTLPGIAALTDKE